MERSPSPTPPAPSPALVPTVPVPPPSERKSVLTSARALAERHALDAAHLCAENRASAASIAVPATLGYTRGAPLATHAAVVPDVAAAIRARTAAHADKIRRLRKEYRRRHRAWLAYCAELDRQHGAREAHAPTSPAAPTAPTGPARSRRSHPGDAVRSEAEFLEILATLEHEDMQDPARRAARTAARTPDMQIALAGERCDAQCIDHDNVYIADSRRFFCSEFDPDVWSDAERGVFARRYALYPKQFGRIAAGLPGKSTQQCVRYYYLHKHAPGVDFKVLSRERSRERKKKPKGRPKKAKGSALLADIATSKEPEPEPEPEPERKRRRSEDSPRSPSPPSAPPSAPPPPAASERDLAAAEALEALAGAGARPTEPKKSRSRGSHWSAHEKAEFVRFLPVYGRDWAALSAALPSKSSAQARNYFARHASETPFFHAATAHAEAHAALPLDERIARAEVFVKGWESEEQSAGGPAGSGPAAAELPATLAGPPAAPPTAPPTAPLAPAGPAPPAPLTAPLSAPLPPARSSDDETDDEAAPQRVGAPYAVPPGMYMPVRYPGVPYRVPYAPYAPGAPYAYGYIGAYDGMRRVPAPLRPNMGYFQLPDGGP